METKICSTGQLQLDEIYDAVETVHNECMASSNINTFDPCLFSPCQVNEIDAISLKVQRERMKFLNPNDSCIEDLKGQLVTRLHLGQGEAIFEVGTLERVYRN
jgi:hypothetical protein